MIKFYCYLLFFFAALNAQSQHRPWIARQENEAIKKISQEVTEDGYVYYKEDAKVKYNYVFSKHKGAYGLSENDSMRLARTVEGDLNNRHYCYQQYYKGICVEGGEYLVHADKDGTVNSTNGHLVESLRQDVKPRISEEKALAIALKSVNAQRYAWEDTAWEHQIKLDLEDKNATYYPKGDIVLARKPGKEDYERDSYVLAYKFDITAVEPFQHLEHVWIDCQAFLAKMMEINMSCRKATEDSMVLS